RCDPSLPAQRERNLSLPRAWSNRTGETTPMRTVSAILLALLLATLITTPSNAGPDAPSFTTLDAPGAGLTLVHGINNRGHLVGSSRAGGPAGDSRGFLFDKEIFTAIDVPASPQTEPQDINDREQVVGGYFAGPSAPRHGFLKDGNTFTTID